MYFYSVMSVVYHEQNLPVNVYSLYSFQIIPGSFVSKQKREENRAVQSSLTLSLFSLVLYLTLSDPQCTVSIKERQTFAEPSSLTFFTLI